jgi:hypothetical protein
VALVNVLGCLWVHDVELSGQVEEVVVQVGVGHDLDHFVELILVQILKN